MTWIRIQIPLYTKITSTSRIFNLVIMVMLVIYGPYKEEDQADGAYLLSESEVSAYFFQ